jgi:hypothetical protein
LLDLRDYPMPFFDEAVTPATPGRARCSTAHASVQRDPAWRALYRATRPKVERKIAHMMRRKHGGRRACTRGRLRVGDDFALLATAVNLARLAALGLGRLGTRAD